MFEQARYPFNALKCCRYVRLIRPNVPLCDLASLNWVSHKVPSSPANLVNSTESEFFCANSLGTGVDTHRVPISALKRFTSHLTSLRRKERNRQKEQTKRAREKDRSSYEAH